MERRRKRRGELQVTLDEKARLERYREIWEIIIWDIRERTMIPHHVRIRQAPRIRGVGRAAARAGF